ncbi:MAG: mechanosensitive ion channel family protein [Nannocystales bacterium]
MELIESLGQHPAAIKVVVTVGILLLIVLGRRLAVRTFDTSGLPPERRNRFLVQSRNAAIVLFLAATVVLWAEQLQTVALSLAALGAAFVIATKELILCLSGTFLRISARSFRLGDRIEVNGTRGDVIDIGPLTTTLLEVGPEPSIHKLTGRMVVLPNSLFLNTPVVNETFTEEFVLHTTRIELDADTPWREAEAKLLEAANKVCRGYVEKAQKNMERVGHKHGLQPPDVTPKVWVSTRNPALRLILRYPAPMRGRGQVEQSILRAYLDYRDATRAKTDAAPPEA